MSVKPVSFFEFTMLGIENIAFTSFTQMFALTDHT